MKDNCYTILELWQPLSRQPVANKLATSCQLVANCLATSSQMGIFSRIRYPAVLKERYVIMANYRLFASSISFNFA